MRRGSRATGPAFRTDGVTVYRRLGAPFALALLVAAGVPAAAQDPEPPGRLVTFRFRPTARAQVAVRVEKPDAGIFRTLVLTEPARWTATR